MSLILDGTNGLSDVDGTAAAPAIRGTDANTGIFFPAADNIAFAEGGVESVRIDASGNVGIGTTSPNYLTTFYKASLPALQLANSTSGSTASDGFLIYLNGANATISNEEAGFLVFQTSGTERARIDSSGNLLVGTTSNTRSARLRVNGDETAHFTGYGNSYGVGLFMTPNASASGGTANAISFQNVSNATVGTISTTASATAYNTSSDYRLKNTIAPMTGALAKVALLKPCTYKWNADGSDGQGFIAHELQAVLPDAVTGEKDAVDEEGNIKPQGIDTSFLSATLTAALQELHAIVKAQAVEIADLKARLP